MQGQTQNVRFLPVFIHLAWGIVWLCSLVAGFTVVASTAHAAQITVHSDPFMKIEEGAEQTYYYLSYYGTEYPSCKKTTKEALAECEHILPNVTPTGCSTMDGVYSSGRYYDFRGGNHTHYNSQFTFRSVAEVTPHNCNTYANTFQSRTYTILSVVETASTNNCISGRASGDSLVPPPVGQTGCIDLGLEGCSMFVDSVTEHHYATGDTYSWSARVSGTKCDPNANDEFTVTAEQVANNQNDENAINDANPFVCTDTPDGLLSCVNLNHVQDPDPYIEHTDNQQGNNPQTEELTLDGCTAIADGQYWLCEEPDEPPQNNDGISENDSTLISETTYTNITTQNTTNISQYMHEGSAVDHGQPDNSTDTGLDVDGDGDSDGDVDGDGDSDNGDLVAKLESLNRSQRQTTNELAQANDTLDSIESNTASIAEQLENINNAGDFNSPDDADDIATSTGDYFGRLQQAPIVQAVQNIAPVEQQGSCPSLDFSLPWGNVSTTLHCDIWQTVKPIIETVAVVAWSIAAFVILFSA